MRIPTPPWPAAEFEIVGLRRHDYKCSPCLCATASASVDAFVLGLQFQTFLPPPSALCELPPKLNSSELHPLQTSAATDILDLSQVRLRNMSIAAARPGRRGNISTQSSRQCSRCTRKRRGSIPENVSGAFATYCGYTRRNRKLTLFGKNY